MRKFYIVLFALIGLGFYFLLGIGIWFFISIAILIIGLLYLLLYVLKTGESYRSYYKSTMLDLLLNVYGNLNCEMSSVISVDDNDISEICYIH